MSESQIAAIRTQLKNLRHVIDQEKEREFVERSARLNYLLEDLIYSLHKGGMSINRIAQEYGTKNWQTIKDIIKRAEENRAMLQQSHADAEPTITVEPFTDPNGYPNTYRVTVSNYGPDLYSGKIDVYRVNPESPIMPMPDSFEPGAVLHSDVIKREPRIIDPIKEAMG